MHCYRRFLFLSLLLIGLINCLTACGDSTDVSSQATAPKPYGNYFTNLIMSDLRWEPFGFSKYLGRWDLKLGENNLFSFKLNNSEVADGTYEWTEEQLIFYDGTMAMDCSSYEEGKPSGIYRWSFDGKTLSLSKVMEICYGRGIVLRAHYMTRAS